MTRPTFPATLLAAALIAVPMLSLPALAQDAAQDAVQDRAQAATAQTAEGADQVVATVDGQDITLGQMIVMKQSIQDPAMAELPDQALWDMMLDQLIRQTAVAASAEETAGVRAQMELQRRNIMAAAAVSQIAGAEPAEEELQARYDQLFAEAGNATEYNAAHILVETEEKATELKAELDGGADFGDVAEANSTGPSGPNRGDLGWFTADQMVPPFAEAVAAMEPGGVSDPVQTDFGWHIIQLNETRLREAPPLAEVRDEISQMVLREKVEAEIARLVEAAEIQKTEGVDPAALSDIDLLEAN
ncbi:peptidylprolyl isomerase [Paracoccus liaowanqingii]|uniref:Parvulin-like PPIase n=1 Tax=Paracoccus liaowanqingii TaxID=2560053 RepID=A0A4Z1C159_9RHOB|nr:peptidylprolyl isomerase [Paracoccus liaowanqingii]TGN62284.1 peptidylprolyl isomerase [Paracoccus liaowanqingii]